MNMVSKSKGLHRFRWALCAPIKLWITVSWKPRVGFHLSPSHFSLSLLFISFGVAYQPVYRDVRKEGKRIYLKLIEKEEEKK